MSTIECQKICKKASDLGNSESQINRATSFISGAGVKKDKNKAQIWKHVCLFDARASTV